MSATGATYGEPAPAPAAAPATSASLDYDLDELERLAELKEQGIITEAEFTAKKREILGL